MENVYTNVSRHECENERMVCMAIVRNGGSYTRKGRAVLYRQLWVVVITRLRVVKCLRVLKRVLKDGTRNAEVLVRYVRSSGIV